LFNEAVVSKNAPVFSETMPAIGARRKRKYFEMVQGKVDLDIFMACISENPEGYF
jgi:hypothetical protein